MGDGFQVFDAGLPKEAASQIAVTATTTIRGNPTVKCADGNARVLSSQDNVVKIPANVITHSQFLPLSLHPRLYLRFYRLLAGLLSAPRSLELPPQIPYPY